MGKRKREEEENGEEVGEVVKKTKKEKDATTDEPPQEDLATEEGKVTKKEIEVKTEEPSYEELAALVNSIAQPLAGRKLAKKLFKVVKKSQAARRLKRGVREVVKGLRKNEKGVVILAGDVSPIDVISHIPVFCEDKDVPYCYVPSRKNLGAASLTKRPTSVVLVQPADDYKTLYDECYNYVNAMPLPI